VAYDHAAAHQPGARYAPAAFLSGFLNASIDLEARLAALELPVTILWGWPGTAPAPRARARAGCCGRRDAGRPRGCGPAATRGVSGDGPGRSRRTAGRASL